MQIKGPGGGGPIKGPEDQKEPQKADVEKAPTSGPADAIERIPKSAFTERLPGIGGLTPQGPGGGVGASHVNSGPTGHSNGAGHANFSSNPDFQKFENHVRGLLQPKAEFATKPAFQHFAERMGSLLDRVGSSKIGDPGTAHANNIPPDAGAGRTTLPAGQLAVGGLGPAAAHANSGPTGHSNGAGHANFSREAIFDKFVNQANTLLDKAASHVNSGPTGHSNGAGHANFADRGQIADKLSNPAGNLAKVGLPGAAASHVNSGPTGHSNGAGHANFADDNRFQQYVNEFREVLQQGRTSLLGNAASHVNSGPTGHSNGAGHANFSDVGNPGDKFGNPGGGFTPGGG